MRTPMTLIPALGLALGLAAAAQAGALGETPVSMPAPYRPLSFGGGVSNFQPAPAGPALRPLAHRWGFGLDSIPGATSNPLGGLVAEPNAVALRWWASNRLGFDLLGALSSSSLQQGASSSATGNGGDVFGVGLAVKYNLSEPSKDLLAQLLARGSYASAQLSDNGGQLDSTAVFVGAGFEAFVPGWEWLSLEGSAGVTLSSQDLKPSGATTATTATQSNSTISLGGSGFSPVNVSIHVYF